MKRGVRAAALRRGYEDFRKGAAYRYPAKIALAFEWGRLTAAELLSAGQLLEVWRPNGRPPARVLQTALRLRRMRSQCPN